jgi:hypothetical protein
VFLSLNADAQVLADSSAYNKGLLMVDSAKTAEEYKKAGNYFEALSISRPNWGKEQNQEMIRKCKHSTGNK